MSFLTDPSRTQVWTVTVIAGLCLLIGGLLPLGTRGAIKDDSSLSCNSKSDAWGYLSAAWAFIVAGAVLFLFIAIATIRCVKIDPTKASQPFIPPVLKEGLSSAAEGISSSIQSS